jgi:hypothetical protein
MQRFMTSPNFIKIIFMGACCEQKGAVLRCLGIYLFVYSLIGRQKRTQYIVAKERNLEDGPEWTQPNQGKRDLLLVYD